MGISDKPPAIKSPLVCSQRLTLTLMAFLGTLFVYVVRVNLSVAIICMVRSDVTVVNGSLSNVTNVTSHTDDSCGGSDQALTADRLREDTGEFSWDKGTQSKLLVMYFYGYIFTQVPGPLLGNIFTFSISGVLCTHGFDNGWGSIFYLSGLFYLLWVMAWFPVTSDTPAKHKRISAREQNYIETSIGKSSVAKVLKVPWLSMFRSGPLWAIIIAHFCNNYINYTLLTSLPTFMKESLKFDISQNGFLSSAPYLTQFVTSLAGGVVADKLRQRGVMSTRVVRRSFQAISFWGSAVCIVLAGQMTCDQRYWAVVLLCLCVGFMGLNRSGYTVNHLDLAPAYAGILFGITNTAATIPGMIAPLVAGAMTPNRSAEEWRSVFYVCGAVAAVGGIIYVILADGELQEWAVPPDVSGNTGMTYPADGKEEEGSHSKDGEESEDCDIAHPISVTERNQLQTKA
ncbi:sialin [Aplysia californica]|uniref:Sialin n=1 Tax=Aplysia californica TaxID=6500 RepID=A0ABM1VVC2_APLCA|nr:sialin [Aplysia californica]